MYVMVVVIHTMSSLSWFSTSWKWYSFDPLHHNVISPSLTLSLSHTHIRPIACQAISIVSVFVCVWIFWGFRGVWSVQHARVHELSKWCKPRSKQQNYIRSIFKQHLMVHIMICRWLVFRIYICICIRIFAAHSVFSLPLSLAQSCWT